MSGPGKGDARGYSWPPFEPGHERSIVSGYRSERRVGPLADQLEAELLAMPDLPPYLHEAAFRPALLAYCRAQAIVDLLTEYLSGRDVTAALAEAEVHEETEERTKSTTTRRGKSRRVQSALDALHKHETRAANLRARLGLDPMSQARISRDLSQSRWYAGKSPLDLAVERIQAEEERQALEAGGSDDG